ncbi:hypothetical protein HYX03_04735, partial [Candidatus Woesearchaeota archaeon]|nr:hypothetical protein [Candidatus Woesearchaeota archaeon]
NDAPRIEIEGLEFPINVSYNENFSVSFTLAKKSQSSPKYVEVVFAQNGFRKKWSIDELTENEKFVLNFVGKDLKYGKNNYKINVNYYDGLKKQYSSSKDFPVELTNVTLLQRLILWFNDFENASPQTLILMLFVIAVAFMGLIGWLWRRNK